MNALWPIILSSLTSAVMGWLVRHRFPPKPGPGPSPAPAPGPAPAPAPNKYIFPDHPILNRMRDAIDEILQDALNNALDQAANRIKPTSSSDEK